MTGVLIDRAIASYRSMVRVLVKQDWTLRQDRSSKVSRSDLGGGAIVYVQATLIV